jgi:hypothetical protein
MGDGRFPFEMGNGVPVVAAPEEIDITSAPALRSALLEAAAHGHGTLVADMILTQFCDSSGLHAPLTRSSRKHPMTGRTAIGELAAHPKTAKRTGSSHRTALASWTEKPADRDACASVARRAPGGPPQGRARR